MQRKLKSVSAMYAETIKKSIKTDNTPEDVAKDAEADVQKLHDKYIKRVDEVFAEKEREIMTV